eukprot:2514301-Rhodomonas_salina.1
MLSQFQRQHHHEMLGQALKVARKTRFTGVCAGRPSPPAQAAKGAPTRLVLETTSVNLPPPALSHHVRRSSSSARDSLCCLERREGNGECMDRVEKFWQWQLPRVSVLCVLVSGGSGDQAQRRDVPLHFRPMKRLDFEGAFCTEACCRPVCSGIGN